MKQKFFMLTFFLRISLQTKHQISIFENRNVTRSSKNCAILSSIMFYRSVKPVRRYSNGPLSCNHKKKEEKILSNLLIHSCPNFNNRFFKDLYLFFRYSGSCIFFFLNDKMAFYFERFGYVMSLMGNLIP